MDSLIGKIVVGVISKLFADEVKAWVPYATDWITRSAVRILPVKLRDRFQEEWRSHLGDVPTELARLTVSFGFLIAACHIASSERIQQVRLMLRLLWFVVRLRANAQMARVVL